MATVTDSPTKRFCILEAASFTPGPDAKVPAGQYHRFLIAPIDNLGFHLRMGWKLCAQFDAYADASTAPKGTVPIHVSEAGADNRSPHRAKVCTADPDAHGWAHKLTFFAFPAEAPGLEAWRVLDSSAGGVHRFKISSDGPGHGWRELSPPLTFFTPRIRPDPDSRDPIPPPVEWTPGLPPLALVPVDPYSVEFSKVSDVTRRGDFTHKILHVHRLQNSKLWERYAWTRERIERESGIASGNELWVVHGTGSTPPDTVWTSTLGIDMRYSHAGMYGKAAYFAEQLAYTDGGYAHPVVVAGQRCKQVFVARLAAGKVEKKAPDRDLKHPSTGFHTIEGIVRSPDFKAYMAYEPYMSYPAYLVTYTTPAGSSAAPSPGSPFTFGGLPVGTGTGAGAGAGIPVVAPPP